MSKDSAVRDKDRSLPVLVLLFIMNAFFFIWYCLFTFVIGLIVLTPNYIYHRGWRPGRHPLAIRRFIQFYGRMVIRLSWPIVRIRVENIENAKNIEPCVYVFNHFSFADVYFAGYLPAYQTVVAVRSWPFKIPVLNIFMRIAEYMDVEKTQWEEILAQSEKILKDGGCILFFPEGHRSRNGSMHPLNKGAFRIAADNNVPIVPVSLQGTEYLGGYKSRMPVSPCRVKLRFYPPMRANGKEFTDVNDLRERVEKLYLREVYNK